MDLRRPAPRDGAQNLGHQKFFPTAIIFSSPVCGRFEEAAHGTFTPMSTANPNIAQHSIPAAYLTENLILALPTRFTGLRQIVPQLNILSRHTLSVRLPLFAVAEVGQLSR